MVNAADSPPASAAEMMARLNSDHSFELNGMPSGQWRDVDSQTFAFHFSAAPESHDFVSTIMSRNGETMLLTLKYSSGETGHQRWTRVGSEGPAVASQTTSATQTAIPPTPSAANGLTDKEGLGPFVKAKVATLVAAHSSLQASAANGFLALGVAGLEFNGTEIDIG